VDIVITAAFLYLAADLISIGAKVDRRRHYSSRRSST